MEKKRELLETTNEHLKIALFDAKPYDIRFFTELNEK